MLELLVEEIEVGLSESKSEVNGSGLRSTRTKSPALRSSKTSIGRESRDCCESK
jgi:hypothetical protein